VEGKERPADVGDEAVVLLDEACKPPATCIGLAAGRLSSGGERLERARPAADARGRQRPVEHLALVDERRHLVKLASRLPQLGPERQEQGEL